MIATTDVPIFLSLLATGFLGSVHCIGMCGPLLLAFDGALVGPDGGRPGRVHGFVAYHAGRLWTYAVLGTLAGGLGAAARDRLGSLHWQRPLAIGLAVSVVLVGLALLGVSPGLRGGGQRWAAAILVAAGLFMLARGGTHAGLRHRDPRINAEERRCASEA